jgi:hypothetical protein
MHAWTCEHTAKTPRPHHGPAYYPRRMPLPQKTLDALTKLGAVVPEGAASLPSIAVWEQTRFPTGDLESRPNPKHWFEPRRLGLHRPQPFERALRNQSPGPYVAIGATDAQALLWRVSDGDAADPSILVFEYEDGESLALPLSTLLKNLRPKKPTPKALKQLVDGIEKPSLEMVTEALREGANVNASIKRDIAVSPLVLALRRMFYPGVPAIITTLLDAGADPNHPVVISTILSGSGAGSDVYDDAVAAIFAHGGRLPSKHMAATAPCMLVRPKTLELMIDHGLDVNANVMNAYVNPMIALSSLCEAAWRGGYERAEVLVRRGADVHYVAEPYGVTPLHFAVLSADAARLVPLLVERGARDRRSRAVPKGLFRWANEPVVIDAPGETARELATRIGRADIAAMIPEA